MWDSKQMIYRRQFSGNKAALLQDDETSNLKRIICFYLHVLFVLSVFFWAYFKLSMVLSLVGTIINVLSKNKQKP